MDMSGAAARTSPDLTLSHRRMSIHQKKYDQAIAISIHLRWAMPTLPASKIRIFHHQPLTPRIIKVHLHPSMAT